uniref:Uncharacterized protein n=1 Tax=Poecilia reticulata TaxID=8081 RepID=A0A3P9QC93_POERE
LFFYSEGSHVSRCHEEKVVTKTTYLNWLISNSIEIFNRKQSLWADNKNKCGKRSQSEALRIVFVKHGGVSIILWACLAASDTDTLHRVQILKKRRCAGPDINP